MRTVKLFTMLLLILSSVLIEPYSAQEIPENKKSEIQQLGINETYNDVRNGIRLILSYNHGSSSFVGTAENITEQILQSVSVRIILSSGSSLGPIFLTEVMSGDTRTINLSDEHQMFNWWIAHISIGGKTNESSSDANATSGERSAEDIHVEERNYENIHSGENSTENINSGERSTEDVHSGEKSQSDIHKEKKSNKNIHEGEHSEEDLK